MATSQHPSLAEVVDAIAPHNKALQADLLVLLTVLGAQDAAGALLVLRVLERVLLAATQEPSIVDAALWAKVADTGARAIPTLPHKFAHLKVAPESIDEGPAWQCMLRLAALYNSDDLHEGVQRIAGVLLCQRLRRPRVDQTAPITFEALDARTASRLRSMAGACQMSSKRIGAPQWKALAALLKLTSEEVSKVIQDADLGELKEFADALCRALDRDEPLVRPQSAVSQLAGTPPAPSPQGPDVPGTQALKEKKSGKKPRKPPRRKPGAAGLLANASFAPTAMVFAIRDHWNWLAPNSLRPVVAGLMDLLQPGTSTRRCDMALVLLLGLVIRHNARLMLRLSVRRDDDLWFCQALGCVLVSRKRLLDLSGTEEACGCLVVVLPAVLVKALRARLAMQPDARELIELLPSLSASPGEEAQAAWLTEAGELLKSLGDPSQPAWFGRFARSLGPLAVDIGLTLEQASLTTLSLPLAADSSGNYYAVAAQHLNQWADQVSRSAGLGPAHPVPDGMVSGRPGVPSVQQMREVWTRRWAMASVEYEAILQAGDAQVALDAASQAIVMAWQALCDAIGIRPKAAHRLSRADMLTHPRWIRANEKRIPGTGGRLLPRTKSVNEVLGFVECVRARLGTRLREFGFDQSDLPACLRGEGLPTMPYFMAYALHPRRPGRVAATAFSKKLLAKVPSLWSIQDNDGRAFWLSRAILSKEQMVPRLMGGHGRGLAHHDSAALGLPVSTLLQGCERFVQQQVEDLALASFGNVALACTSERTLVLDLSQRTDSRTGANGAAPRDPLPREAVNAFSLPCLKVVEDCRRVLFWPDGPTAGARLLAAVISVMGLVHMEDVVAVWDVLMRDAGDMGQLRLRWSRSSGQPIDIPALAAVRLARALVGAVPPLCEAEADLCRWFSGRWPAVRFGKEPGSVIAGVCFLVAHWLRLRSLPWLVEALRPSTMACTLDAASCDRLYAGDPSPDVGSMDLPQRRRPRALLPVDSVLTEIQRFLHQYSRNYRKDGEDERRALRIGLALRLKFPIADLPEVAAFIVRWLLAEVEYWKHMDSDRDAPVTWYKYLNYLIHGLLQLLKLGSDMANLSAQEWRAMGAVLLNTAATEGADPAVTLGYRRQALTRMCLVLCKDAQYADVMQMLAAPTDPLPAPTYRPSSASVLVTGANVEQAATMLAGALAPWRMDQLLHEAQLRLAVNLCARPDEVNAQRSKDFSRDRARASIAPSGHSHMKRVWNHRPVELDERTQAVVEALLELQSGLRTVPDFPFADTREGHDLRHGRRRQATAEDAMRLVTGQPNFIWPGLRGVGLQQGLAPDWEVKLMNWLCGPLLAHHAKQLYGELTASGFRHFANAIGASAHLSWRVPVGHYITAWPFFSAIQMAMLQTEITFDPNLLEQLGGVSRGTARKRSHDLAHKLGREPDDWASWARDLHPDWNMRVERALPEGRSPLGGVLAVGDGVNVVMPSLSDPMRVGALRYLLMRTLQVSPSAAETDACVPHDLAACLEAAGVSLRRFSDVHWRGPRWADEPTLPRKVALGRLHDELGQQLSTRLAFAPLDARRCLTALLESASDHVTADRVRAALKALPAGLGLELVWRPEDLRVDLVADLRGQDRLRLDTKREVREGRPRVRVLPAAALDGGGVAPSTADWDRASFTALTRLGLSIVELIDPTTAPEGGH